MSEHYGIVPWFNSEEWFKVYEDLRSEKSNKENAVNLIQMWKARCPSLPSGIESTLSLLQVQIQDNRVEHNIANDQMLRMAYSSAVMRFVNHMLDTETAKGLSLYSAAKFSGVPDWIVDMRHDAAHSHNLPSITLLRNACSICLQWLQKTYWDRHESDIQDYRNNVDENKIATMLYFCSCISICAYSKIKKLADISDPTMQNSIITDAKILFGDINELSDTETVSISALVNMLNTNAKKILKATGSTYHLNKALIEEDHLILSLDLLEHLSEHDFNHNKKLNTSYVLCFEVFLTFLHTHDLILEFILALVKITQTVVDCPRKPTLAALWLSQILAALKKSKQFVERANKMKSVGAASNKKKDLKLLYHHWFPNETLDGLTLDLQKPVPRQLTDINFIQPIISLYNPYVTYFVEDLLNLVNPSVPKQVREKICMLAKLISAPEHFPADLSSAKIYTVEDLKSDYPTDDILTEKTGDLNDSNSEMANIHGIWRIASEHNWSRCPIGTVPWEDDQGLDVDME